jgi:hypothetical protein
MTIHKLILCNFRQFIGEQTVYFSTDKERNVTVFVGDNTSGKTTFINAFQWILYDNTAFFDKILLNKDVANGMSVGERQSVCGTLVIEHDGTTYEITRKADYICSYAKSEEQDAVVKYDNGSKIISYLQSDGQTKTKIESQFEENIERILPKDLSEYFFFGGEKIGSIASKSSIKKSVTGLMGLNVLDNAMKHLKLVRKTFDGKLDYSGDTKALDYQSRITGAEAEIKACEDRINEINDDISFYTDERDKYTSQLKAYEETAKLQKDRETLIRTIDSLNRDLAQSKTNLVKVFSNGGFAFFSRNLLNEALSVLKNTSDDTECVPGMEGDAIDYLLKRGKCICGTAISPGSLAEQLLLQEKKKLPPESIGTVVKRYKDDAREFLNTSEQYYQQVEQAYTAYRKARKDLEFREEELKAISDKLLGAKDSSAIEQKRANAVRKIRELEEERRKKTQAVGAAEQIIKNSQDSMKRHMAQNLNNAKYQELLNYTDAIYDWIEETYKKREASVKTQLEDKVNANFSRMYHGTRNIMIDDNYRVKYYDVTTEESEGLKAVKSFAFVCGLVDLAKQVISSGDSDDEEATKEFKPMYFPLVMDAPFSNMDTSHIRNVSDILPQSANQVIIAVMKKDWEPAADIMSRYVGMTYSIQKNRDINGKEIDTMSSFVKDGE